MKTNEQLCSVPVCKRKHHCNGYCEPHNKEFQRHGEVQNREIKERPSAKDEKIYTRLRPAVSEKFERRATEKGMTPYSLAREVLEDFAEGRLKKAGGRR